jgi:hypothetical protein
VVKIIELEQGSPEWHAFRLGRIAGTRLGSIWSSRQYTKDDVEKLLLARNVDLVAYKAELDEARGKKKPLVKGDLEKLLTEEDKEVLSTDAEKKLEYYQLLADQVAVAPADELINGEENKYYNAMERGIGEEDTAAQLFASKFDKKLMVVGCCVADEDDRIMNSPDRLVKPAGKSKKITEAVEIKCLGSAKHLMAFFERKIPEEYWTQKVQYFTVNPDLQRLYWVFYDPRVSLLPMFVLVIEREDLGHWPETMLKYQLRTLKELDVLTARLFDESDNIMLRAKAEKGIDLL